MGFKIKLINMRLTLITIVLLIFTWSCGEKIYTGDVNCDECYTDKPENADLIIDLTIDGRNPEVPVIVYEGNVEDNKVITTDTVDYSPFYVYVRVGKEYAVKAEYKKDNATLFVIDGTKLKVKSADACDTKCYVIDGETLDARIK
jgi:hypothetical protein